MDTKFVIPVKYQKLFFQFDASETIGRIKIKIYLLFVHVLKNREVTL